MFGFLNLSLSMFNVYLGGRRQMSSDFLTLIP